MVFPGESMREAEMIRFVEMAVFSGVQQLSFIRKTTDSVVKVRTIRFVSLTFMSLVIPSDSL
jgi:hypothetical protein